MPGLRAGLDAPAGRRPARLSGDPPSRPSDRAAGGGGEPLVRAVRDLPDDAMAFAYGRSRTAAAPASEGRGDRPAMGELHARLWRADSRDAPERLGVTVAGGARVGDGAAKIGRAHV